MALIWLIVAVRAVTSITGMKRTSPLVVEWPPMPRTIPAKLSPAGALDVWAGTAASTTNGHGNRDNQVAAALKGLAEDAADAELMTRAV